MCSKKNCPQWNVLAVFLTEIFLQIFQDQTIFKDNNSPGEQILCQLELGSELENTGLLFD